MKTHLFRRWHSKEGYPASEKWLFYSWCGREVVSKHSAVEEDVTCIACIDARRKNAMWKAALESFKARTLDERLSLLRYRSKRRKKA